MNSVENLNHVYNQLYQSGYPHGGLGFPISWSKIKCKDLTCLDIGCGHGILGKKFKKYVGVDISDFVIRKNKEKYPELKFYHKDILNLPNLGKFDIVIAIDVLEHFPEEIIEDYLKKIAEIEAKTFLFSICCRGSGFKSFNGEDLHTCIKTKEEWLILLKEYFEIIDHSELNRQKTFCVRCK